MVEPATHYFRINPLFEAPKGKYDWLNRVISVGIGHRRAHGPIYSVFEVLSRDAAFRTQTAHVDVTAANTFPVGMHLLLGTACGLLIASLYYAQPLTGRWRRTRA
jgi:hypothetical protein